MYRKQIKIYQGLFNLFKERRKLIFNVPHEPAVIGILASKNGIIDSVYFVPGIGGCSWFPKIAPKDMASTLCKIIKDKVKIRGVVVIHTLDMFHKSGEGDESGDHITVCATFRAMIVKYRYTRNKSHLYLVYGADAYWAYRLQPRTKGLKKYDYEQIKLKEVG